MVYLTGLCPEIIDAIYLDTETTNPEALSRKYGASPSVVKSIWAERTH
jgi:hypothetical protein